MIFKNILTVDKELQMEILTWRNHIEIRKNMYNDYIITQKEHIKWLNNLKMNKDIEVYLSYKNKTPIGVVSLNKIDLNNFTSDWAFYLNPNYLTQKGLGALIEYHFLNFVFENRKIEKLNCEVLETNPTVIKLHKKFFFTEEGIRRKNIIKNNKRINIHLLGILKEEWLSSREKLEKIIKRLESENR